MRIENDEEQQLIVANEQLSSLDDVVMIMPTAQYLNVAFNSLSTLDGLEQMKELRCLDISHNAVESLQEVATLSKLLVLKCSSNRITDLRWITKLIQLEELWIRDNCIESSQIAHLRQLPALATLVIHPNPCTKRKDYVLTMLNVLPRLQCIDTVVLTEELRAKARQIDERGVLDSRATDCTLGLLSGRADDPASNDSTPEISVATLPAMPPKMKKQTKAEQFMRAFPVQQFIPLDCNENQSDTLDRQHCKPEASSLQLYEPDNQINTQPGTVKNVRGMAEHEHALNNDEPILRSKSDATRIQLDPDIKTKMRSSNDGVSALSNSVLTLPTIEDYSLFMKKKAQTYHGKQKSRFKHKIAGPRSSAPLLFRQDKEYSIRYPNSTVVAILVRYDGSAIARWPSGNVAISVDYEGSGDRAGYRTYAAHQDGQLALSFDPAGVGVLNAYPSGKTLLSTAIDGSGLLFDPKNGAILRQWSAQGKLCDGLCQQADQLGNEPDGSLLCLLSDHLAVRVQLAHLTQPARPESSIQEAVLQTNPISLHIYFAGAPNFRHKFVNSFNRAEPSSENACDCALGRESKESKERVVETKSSPLEHIDLLSSIRAAVAEL